MNTRERLLHLFSSLLLGLIIYLSLRYFGKVPALNWGPWQLFDDIVMLGLKIFLYVLVSGLGLFFIQLYFNWLVNRRCNQDYKKLCEFAQRLKSDVSAINYQTKRLEEIISVFDKKLNELKKTLDSYPPPLLPENVNDSAEKNALQNFL